MKVYCRIIAILILCILCFPIIPAQAITSAEKESNYAAAILQLETYLENAGNSSADLAGIESAFRELGGYEQSRFLRYYVSALIKIADEEYDFELDTILDMMDSNVDFKKYLEESLKGSPIGSIEKLKFYSSARKYEHEGKIEAAIVEYKKCLSFFGADERYTSLMKAHYDIGYEKAKTLLKSNDYAGAYYQFAELAGYSDSKQWMDSIVRQLGYTPSSPTDNLMPVTGLKISNNTVSEVTLSWNRSEHATSYDVYYKKHNDTEWIGVGSVTTINKKITVLNQEISYDFKVIAAIDQIKANEAVLENHKIVSIALALTPSPVPSETDPPNALSGSTSNADMVPIYNCLIDELKQKIKIFDEESKTWDVNTAPQKIKDISLFPPDMDDGAMVQITQMGQISYIVNYYSNKKMPITYAYLESDNGFNFELEERNNGIFSTIKETRIVGGPEMASSIAYFFSIYCKDGYITNKELRDKYPQYRRKIDSFWIPKDFVDSFVNPDEVLIIFVQGGSNDSSGLSILIFFDGKKYAITQSGIRIYDYSKEKETLYINYNTDNGAIKSLTNRGKNTK